MKRNKRLIQVIALVLVVLLVGGVVVGALVSALAESPAPAANRCELTMEYLEEEQALHIGQRLAYVNRTGAELDRVVFHAAPNMFRRESALMYENDDLDAVFPSGYAPGGMDLRSVKVDGAEADYGFIGEEELSLRVGCHIAPGAAATFEFDYYLLLTACNAFVGAGDTDVRLTDFCFIPGAFDPEEREFIVNRPLPFTRWLHTDAMDWEVALSLPEGYDLAAPGSVEERDGVWHVSQSNARAFALAFGRRWRSTEGQAASGASIRVLTGARGADRVVEAVRRAVDRCEEWFGPLPVAGITVAESDYPLGPLNAPGLVLMPKALFESGEREAMEKAVRFCVAQQYFGLSACVEPSADAWLSDSLCEYLSYLMLEAEEGHEAFLKALNRDWVSALQLTVPGGLRVTSDASLFDAKQYDIVVRRRGAVVFHELRLAMGTEAMLEGLRGFFRLGQDGRTLTEMDLVRCLDDASGRSWEDFLTDWVFNVGEYVNQSIDWLE